MKNTSKNADLQCDDGNTINKKKTTKVAAVMQKTYNGVNKCEFIYKTSQYNEGLLGFLK